MPAIEAASTIRLSVTIWSLSMPTTLSSPTEQPRHLARAEPARVDQRIGPVMLDEQRRRDQADAAGKRPADPASLGPPFDPSFTEHRDHQPQARRQQQEGEEVELLERLDPFAGRQRQRHHRGEGRQGQPELEPVEHVPVAPDQQAGRQGAGEGRGELRDADADHDPGEPLGRGHRLRQVENGQGGEPGGRDPAGGAHRDRGPEPMDEQMRDRRQRIARQDVADEDLQAELLPELHEQQVGGDVGHEIGGGQPGRLVAVEAERPLREVEIDRDERIAEPRGHPDEAADREIAEPAARRMIGIGRRPGQGRPLMRLEHIVCGLGHAAPRKERPFTGGNLPFSLRQQCDRRFSREYYRTVSLPAARHRAAGGGQRRAHG
jgi:hypothetical protein